MRIQPPLFMIDALAQTQKMISRSLERLSSGKRINTAADDAASLAISTGIDAQVRGLVQGTRNLNDANGFLAAAEQGIGSQLDLSQRMRELAVQSANGTLSKNDRDYLNTEFQQLRAEFDRIAEQTNFNGTKILDGSFNTTNVQVGGRDQQTLSFHLNSTQSSAVFDLSTGFTTNTTATGSFKSLSTSLPSIPQFNELLSTDFNGDGIPDLLTTNYFASNTYTALLGNGDGTFRVSSTIAATSVFSNVAVAGDFNGDGKMDFASISGNHLEIHLGNGDGTFSTSVVDTTAGGFQSLSTADINHDGKLDLVQVDADLGTVSVWLGNGDGSFQTQTTYATSSHPGPFAIGDVNGDGKPDLVIPDHNSNSVSILLGRGDGTFQPQSRLDVGQPTSGIQLADFNGDGKLDLVFVSQATGEVFLSLGHGDGTFGSPARLPGIGSGFPGGIADFNNDGKLDIALTQAGSAAIQVLYGNGDGTFTGGATMSIAAAGVIVTADFNHDGFQDIAVANDSNSTMNVFLAKTLTTTIPNPPLPFDVTTQTDASKLLSVLDEGIQYLNLQRSSIGAYHARLESALNVNSLTEENLAQAKSNILDTDIPTEISTLVKAQILEQAGVAVLAQANLQNKLLTSLISNTQH